MTNLVPQAEPATNQLLPFALTPELMSQWGVEDAYHAAFASASSEDELLALEAVPPHVLEYVLNCIWPPANHGNGSTTCAHDR